MRESVNGEDLNSRPDRSPSRWVINFRDWPLKRGTRGRWHDADVDQRVEWLRSGIVPDDYPDPVAADYPDCLRIVEERVKPERERKKPNGEFAVRKPRRERWWQFAERAPDLYATIAGMERVLTCALVSIELIFEFARLPIVFAHRLAVFPLDGWGAFALLQANVHVPWAWQYSSTMRNAGINYSPSDCFETFPFPDSTAGLDAIGERYHAHRQSIMLARNEGLTKTYNRFHAPAETAADIRQLRDLHVEMDRAVAAAYGWTNLDLGHGVHQTKQGLRFTISEAARQEVLARLLRLNHARYADEVRRGLHARKNRRRADQIDGDPLFDLDHDRE